MVIVALAETFSVWRLLSLLLQLKLTFAQRKRVFLKALFVKALIDCEFLVHLWGILSMLVLPQINFIVQAVHRFRAIPLL